MIEKLLTENRIATNVECSDWREVVKECGKLLVHVNDVEEPFVDSMIEVVEEFGPYMILAPEVAFSTADPAKQCIEYALALLH